MPIVVNQEEKIELICQKAYDEFIQNGIENISLNQLITNIGISKGQFYHYFKTKEELIFQVVSKKTLEFVTKLEDELQKSNSLLGDLQILFKFYICDDKYFTDLRKLMFDTLHIYINSNDEKIKQFNQEMYQWLDEKLIEIFKKYDVNLVSTDIIKSISATADGMYFRSLADSNFNLQYHLSKYLHDIANFVQKG